MPTLYEQRNVSMTPEQWAALEALAVALNCRSTRGPKAYQHSWRTMFEEAAEGKILLIRKSQPVPETTADLAATPRLLTKQLRSQQSAVSEAFVSSLEQEQRIAYEREAAAQGRDITTPRRKLRRSQLDGDAPKKPRSKMAQLDMFGSPPR